jgi:hypothetical protein
MHITNLRAHQVLNSYVKAGSRIHLTAGQICLSEAAAWGDAYGFFHETMLHEGGTYQVQRSGRLLITASKDAEFLSELAEPARLTQFWYALKQIAHLRLTAIAKKFLHHEAL